eukprot:2055528-Rhodomonas_salina.1
MRRGHWKEGHAMHVSILAPVALPCGSTTHITTMTCLYGTNRSLVPSAVLTWLYVATSPGDHGRREALLHSVHHRRSMDAASDKLYGIVTSSLWFCCVNALVSRVADMHSQLCCGTEIREFGALRNQRQENAISTQCVPGMRSLALVLRSANVVPGCGGSAARQVHGGHGQGQG